MLVVKPNKRRMRYMRDSPAENALAGPRGSRSVGRLRWERVFLAIGIAGVVVVGLIVLTGHY
jgi:hypothetical protein